MSKSPGHQQHPAHRVREETINGKVNVSIDGNTIADTDDVIAVLEDGNPVRYYFPRTAITNATLQRSTTTSTCPFKGVAHYYHLALADKTLADAVWSYEDPYDEHKALAGRVAFYDDKLPQIRISPPT